MSANLSPSLDEATKRLSQETGEKSDFSSFPHTFTRNLRETLLDLRVMLAIVQVWVTWSELNSSFIPIFCTFSGWREQLSFARIREIDPMTKWKNQFSSCWKILKRVREWKFSSWNFFFMYIRSGKTSKFIVKTLQWAWNIRLSYPNSIFITIANMLKNISGTKMKTRMILLLNKFIESHVILLTFHNSPNRSDEIEHLCLDCWRLKCIMLNVGRSPTDWNEP